MRRITSRDVLPATPGKGHPYEVINEAVKRAARDEAPPLGERRVTAANPTTDLPATTYSLPAEPPEGTSLRGRSGLRWKRYPAGWSNGVRHAIAWSHLLASDAPLSTVPPAGTDDPVTPSRADEAGKEADDG